MWFLGMTTMIDILIKEIQNRNPTGVREVLARGVDVNLRDSTGRSPLVLAAMGGDAESVALLLSAGASPNSTNLRKNSSALIASAKEGHLEVSRLLVHAGADVNFANDLKETPLNQAVEGKTLDHLDIIHLLVDAGADVNAGQTSTPLIRASRSGSPAIIKTLIEAGARVNQCSQAGTALIAAVEYNRPLAVAVLLSAGADLSITAPADFGVATHRGKTPLEIANMIGEPTIRLLLESRTNPGTTMLSVVSINLRPSERIPAAWQRIIKRQPTTQLGTGRLFAPPATQEEIQFTERQLGVGLPEDFTTSYRMYNGQLDDSPGIILPHAHSFLPSPRYRFMSLAQTLIDWRGLKNVGFEAESNPRRTACDPGIRQALWLPGWIPFATNGASDYYCIDLSPAPDGTSGQVITFHHENSERSLLASSFGVFLEILATALERGDRYCR